MSIFKKRSRDDGFIIENGTLIKYTGSEGVVHIPNGVTSIGEKAFDSCTSLVKVEIPNSVTEIGFCAFRGCINLSDIEIPNSVKAIYGNALWDCKSLKHIVLPDSVTGLGIGVFGGCSNLASIIVDPNNSHFVNDNRGVLFNKSKTVLYQYPAANLGTSYIIPNSVKWIAADAFVSCGNLTYVEIPNSVELIEDAAFSSCTNLESVTIPDSVTSIGFGAFWAVKKVIYNPRTITPDETNWYAKKVVAKESTNFTVKSPTGSSSGFQIENGTLVRYNGFDANVIIPDCVTRIGEKAFANCTNLTHVVIPNSVTSIESSAFLKCTSLTHITIPYGVTSIGSNAFTGCTSLVNIEIPDSVTSIGFAAFYDVNKVIYNPSILTPKNPNPGTESIYGAASFNWGARELVPKKIAAKPVTASAPAFTPTPAAAPAAAADSKFCRSCGNKLPGDSRFCNKCGAKIDY